MLSRNSVGPRRTPNADKTRVSSGAKTRRCVWKIARRVGLRVPALEVEGVRAPGEQAGECGERGKQEGAGVARVLIYLLNERLMR